MATSSQPTDPAAMQPFAEEGIPRVAVTVDVVILTMVASDLRVLLVRRHSWPFEGLWAIPGGFVDLQEALEVAAERKLREVVGTVGMRLEQLYTFGDPQRDPRTRVITVVYYALIDAARFTTLDRETRWFSLYRLPELAFDHAKILEYTLLRLRGKLEYTTIGFELLAPEFTLSELQAVHEVILHRRLDKRNFRKKVLANNLLEETGKTKMEGSHRPARLYRFKPDAAS